MTLCLEKVLINFGYSILNIDSVELNRARLRRTELAAMVACGCSGGGEITDYSQRSTVVYLLISLYYEKTNFVFGVFLLGACDDSTTYDV